MFKEYKKNKITVKNSIDRDLSLNGIKKKILIIIFVLFITSVFSVSFAQDSVQVDTTNVATPQPSFWQNVSNNVGGFFQGLTQGAQSGIDNFYNNNTPGPGVPNKAVGDKTPIFTTGPNPYDKSGSSGSSFGTSNANLTTNYSIRCNTSNLTTFSQVVLNLGIGCVLNPLVYVLIGLAVVVFLWGVIKFVISEADSDKQKGKEFILWGIVGLFVMVSVWGLENILEHTFNLNNSNITPRQITLPTL